MISIVLALDRVSQLAKSDRSHLLNVMATFVLQWQSLSSCSRDHMTCKAENIYYLALYRKCFLTLAPDELGVWCRR